MGYGIFTSGGNDNKQLGEIVISTLDLSGTEYLKIPTDTSFNLLSANEIGADPWFYTTLETYPYGVQQGDYKILQDKVQTCVYYKQNEIMDNDKITTSEFDILKKRYGICSRNHEEFYTRYFPGVGKIISLDVYPFDADNEVIKSNGRALCLVDETDNQIYFFRTKGISVNNNNKNNNFNFIPWYWQKFSNNFFLNNSEPISGFLITGQVLYDSIGSSQYSISYFINTLDKKIYPIKLITAQTGTVQTLSEDDSYLHMIKSIAFNGSYLGILYNARPGIVHSKYHRMSCVKNETKMFFEEIFTIDNKSYYQLKLTKENNADEYPKLCTAATQNHNFILPTEEEEKFILLAINAGDYEDMPNFEKPYKYTASGLKNIHYLTGINVTTNKLYDINASIPVPDTNRSYYYYTLFDPTLDKLVVRPAFQNSSTGIYKGYIYENLSRNSRSRRDVEFTVPEEVTSSNSEVYDMKNDVVFSFKTEANELNMQFMDRNRVGKPRKTKYNIINTTNLDLDSKWFPCQVSDLSSYLSTFGAVWTIEDRRAIQTQYGYYNSYDSNALLWTPGYVLPTFSLNDDSRGKLNAFIKIK